MVEPDANAISCLLVSNLGFSACTNNVVTRTFGDCTLLGAVFSGTVTFTWTAAGTTCHLASAGDTIARDPEFSISGLRGGTFAVSKTAVFGQKLTLGSSPGTFTFSNDGIHRVLKDGTGSTLLDFTNETTAPIGISGAARNGRVVNGGTLRVTNNTTGESCDFSPSNVTWGANCNCAISGSWSGSCSSGKTGTVTVTGCGTGTLTDGTTSTPVTFDRCYGS
jgi:hypothetical protein